MQNLEFKAELRDPELARAALRACGAERVGVVTQTDTYFRVPVARLKKREQTAGEPGHFDEREVEYIRYERDDRGGPRISRFTIHTEEEFRERYGASEPPVDVVVRKRREVWVAGRARVHLDEIEGLGRFFEIEILVTRENNMARAHEQMQGLREKLRPCLGELVSGSYADLVRAAGA